MTRKDHPQSTDNVLADLGYADAKDLSAKAVLAVKLNELIDKRSLSQIEAARRLKHDWFRPFQVWA